MARIRSVHPGQWNDDDFLDCSPFARLLALALRNFADDNGIFEWKPRQIKRNCLPADACDVVPLLAELVAHNQVKAFTAGDKEYGAIRNFRPWQRPKTPKSSFPCPAEIRKYVGLETSHKVETKDRKPGPISEIDNTSENGISEIEEDEPEPIPKKPPDDAPPFPRNAEIDSAEGGGRRKEEGGKREEVDARAPVLQLCAELGVTFEANPERINWPGKLRKWLDSGGNLDDLLAAARRAKARGRAEKSLDYLIAMSSDDKTARLAKAASATQNARKERIAWLQVYAMPKAEDGKCEGDSGPSGWRWIKNTSGNGVWQDVFGVGPPPHDPRTLVTERDLELIPSALAKRNEILKAGATT